jgi:poly(3-hydroxybutyrate) depolymerase
MIRASRPVQRWIAAVAALGWALPGIGAPAGLSRLALDPGSVSVSGLSSGGYMAVQFHVSFSSFVKGAGIFAAGPWFCARGSLGRALGECLNRDGSDPDAAGLIAAARQAADEGRVDPLQGLSASRVFVFRGSRDDTLARPVSDALVEFYRAFLPTDSILYVTDVPVAHGVPTLAAGGSCGLTASPYLNACHYDGVGQMLSHLYHGLARPEQPAVAAAASGSGLRRFSQSAYDPAGSLAATGFVYVPARCGHDAKCRLHIAFHGCRQGEEFVGESFVRDAGYNAWAEANDLVVLYPQARRSWALPLNPEGCWDWWGYSDPDYATRRGTQTSAIRDMVRALGGF